MSKERYDHEAVERKWQKAWQESGLYKTGDDSSRPKTYVLDMFPYPSGEGLHVGHPKGYIATDIYSRMKRMQGHNVLHPMGWDAFGLPAENFAIKNKVHPRAAVEKNIANFKEQLAHIGFDYDWSREINTTDPGYYKWTQWIFLKMFEQGLAYQSNEPINWCPSCMTGLANEDLNGNLCDRCDTPVEKKALPQWVLKITAYADRLLKDLDSLDWPEHIKEAQRNWIGRSEGAEIDFVIAGSEEKVRVFTTRPDTIFGATYLVLAPEHPLVETLIEGISNKFAVKKYIASAVAKTEIERGAAKDKSGVKLEDISATNPATNEEIPIFIADYVLASYGTGAIMAVPAHDERDYEFAKKHELPLRRVVEPKFVRDYGDAAVKEGEEMVRREAVCCVVRNPKNGRYLCVKWKTVEMHGLITGGIEQGEDMIESAKREIQEETGYKNLKFVSDPKISINTFFYHRVKRQNRWAHFHYIFFELENDERTEVADEEAALHEVVWKTPKEMKGFFTVYEGEFLEQLLQKPDHVHTGTGILADSGAFTNRDSEEAKWEMVDAVGGKRVTRYKIRDWVFSRQRYWGEPIPLIHCEKDGVVPVPYESLPVTLPEVEHYEPTGTGESPLAAIESWVNVTCPKCGGRAKRETNTMPQWAGSSWYYLRFMDPHNDHELVSHKAEKYFAPVDVYVGGDHAVRHLIYARFWHKFLYDSAVVSTSEPFKRLEFLGFILAPDGRKMSKRFGNVINPTDVVREYGADTFRLYEMFMGPFENTVAWSTNSISGVARFIDRLWRAEDLIKDEPVAALDTVFHQTIKKVSDDIEHFKFNTAVSQFMILLNAVEKEGAIGKGQWQSLLKLLAPFAPHVTEELWRGSGGEGSIHTMAWPLHDDAKLASNTVSLVVQVNGKRRGIVTLSPTASESEALDAARDIASVKDIAPTRVIYVPGKILNLVI